MSRTGVAVEKLARSEFAKIRSRQEALQTISLSLLDIFDHPIFDFFQKNRLFQQPLLLPPAISKCDIAVGPERFRFPRVDLTAMEFRRLTIIHFDVTL